MWDQHWVMIELCRVSGMFITLVASRKFCWEYITSVATPHYCTISLPLLVFRVKVYRLPQSQATPLMICGIPVSGSSLMEYWRTKRCSRENEIFLSHLSHWNGFSWWLELSIIVFFPAWSVRENFGVLYFVWIFHLRQGMTENDLHMFMNICVKDYQRIQQFCRLFFVEICQHKGFSKRNGILVSRLLKYQILVISRWWFY